MRRITVERPADESIAVVTDLLDADSYPAVDLLALYHERWGIERVSTSDRGVRFAGVDRQLAESNRVSVCLLPGAVQHLASGAAVTCQGSNHGITQVSTEKLFLDVQNQLIAWTELATPADTLRLIGPLDLKATCRRLRELLERVWKEVWRKIAGAEAQPAVPYRASRSCLGPSAFARTS